MAADTQSTFVNPNGPRASKHRLFGDLAETFGNASKRPRRVIHCHGVFDLLHIGHIRHLEEARRLGDHLVVTITPDRFVNKGPHRPAFPEALRAEALAALECVDTVCINDWPTAVEAIGAIRPDVFLKGVVAGEGPRDRNGAIDVERNAVEALGGEVVLTDTELHSASALINRHTDILPAELQGFLERFRNETTPAALVEKISTIRSLRILVIGESFAVAKSLGALEPNERYAGGALAVANALSSLCDDVALITAGGDEGTAAKFLKKNVRVGVEAVLLKRSDATAREFEAWLDRLLHHDHVVLHCDCGTGVVSEDARAMVRDRARFYAVDVRSGSRRHQGADLVLRSPSTNREARDEPDVVARNDVLKLESERSWELQLHPDTSLGLVDLPTRDAIHIPAMPINPVNHADDLGTREALFGVAAACSAVGSNANELGFVGSIARAAAATTPGSGREIDATSLFRQIDSLLA